MFAEMGIWALHTVGIRISEPQKREALWVDDWEEKLVIHGILHVRKLIHFMSQPYKLNKCM